ncbi:MAG: LysM peptidoglycan-binding domain-containing protein, partial [Nitrospinae bacterium]|nr:LysM peptidoglycan-binding domain-containing protein [Nitrospinota bacterium]
MPAPRWIPKYRRPAPYQRVHVVPKGETLYPISRRYGLHVEAIERTNGLQDPDN